MAQFGIDGRSGKPSKCHKLDPLSAWDYQKPHSFALGALASTLLENASMASGCQKDPFGTLLAKWSVKNRGGPQRLGPLV